MNKEQSMKTLRSIRLQHVENMWVLFYRRNSSLLAEFFVACDCLTYYWLELLNSFANILINI